MSMPTLIDAIFAAVLFFSAIIGLMRGFVREFLSILGWVAALWVAIRYAHLLTPFLGRFFQSSQWLEILSGVICFVVVLFLINYLSMLLKRGVNHAGLSATDRTLGGIFGLLRGMLVSLMIAYILKEMTPVPETKVWREAWSRNIVEASLNYITPKVSQAIKEWS